jgi:hypothetical protein
VARVSAKGCRVGHDVGEVKGRKGRQLREGRVVGGDYVREASFLTNLA